jgi:hypothetical protein
MSVRTSTCVEPRSCSGDAYVGVPITVSGAVEMRPRDAICALGSSFDTPKSSTLMNGSRSARLQ